MKGIGMFGGLLLAFLLASLTACGVGESGQQSSDADTGTQFTLTLKAPEVVTSGAVVELDATGSKGEQLQFTWDLLLAPEGTHFFYPNDGRINLQAPTVSEESTITFRLSIENGDGEVKTQTANILVKPLAKLDVVELKGREVEIDFSSIEDTLNETVGADFFQAQTAASGSSVPLQLPTVTSEPEIVDITVSNLFDSVSLHDETHFLKITENTSRQLVFVQVSLNDGQNEYQIELPAVVILEPNQSSIQITLENVHLGFINTLSEIIRADDDLFAGIWKSLKTNSSEAAIQARAVLQSLDQILLTMIKQDGGLTYLYDQSGMDDLFTNAALYYQQHPEDFTSFAYEWGVSERNDNFLKSSVLEIYLQKSYGNTLPMQVLAPLYVSYVHTVISSFPDVNGDSVTAGITGVRRKAFDEKYIDDTKTAPYLKKSGADVPYSFRVTNPTSAIYGLSLDDNYRGLISTDRESIFESALDKIQGEMPPFESEPFSSGTTSPELQVYLYTGFDYTDTNIAARSAKIANTLLIICELIDFLVICPADADFITASFNNIADDEFFRELDAVLQPALVAGKFNYSQLVYNIFEAIGYTMGKTTTEKQKLLGFLKKLGVDAEKMLSQFAEKNQSNRVLLFKKILLPMKVYSAFNIAKNARLTFSAPEEVEICAIFEDDGTRLIDDMQKSDEREIEIICKQNSAPEANIMLQALISGNVEQESVVENMVTFTADPASSMQLSAELSKDDRDDFEELKFSWYVNGELAQPVSSKKNRALDYLFALALDDDEQTTVMLKVEDTAGDVSTYTALFNIRDTNIEITSPLDGDNRGVYENIQVDAKVTGKDRISEIRFYVNDQQIEKITSGIDDTVSTTFMPQNFGVVFGEDIVIKVVAYTHTATQFEDSVVLTTKKLEQDGVITVKEVFRDLKDVPCPNFPQQTCKEPFVNSATVQMTPELPDLSNILSPKYGHVTADLHYKFLDTENGGIDYVYSDNYKRLGFTFSELKSDLSPEGDYSFSILTKDHFTGNGIYDLLFEDEGVTYIGTGSNLESLANTAYSTMWSRGCIYNGANNVYSTDEYLLDGYVRVSNYTEHGSGIVSMDLEFSFSCDRYTQEYDENLGLKDVHYSAEFSGTLSGVSGTDMSSFF